MICLILTHFNMFMGQGYGKRIYRSLIFMEIAMIKGKCSYIFRKQEQSVAERLQNKDKGQP